MKWFNKHRKSWQRTPSYVRKNLCLPQHVQPHRQTITLLNIGMLILLVSVISGCGQSLKTLAPIQPVHDIADAQKETGKDSTANMDDNSIPEEELAKPVFDRHGLQTVGVRTGKADVANTISLTYVLAFDEYAHTLDKWYNFLTDWEKVDDQIELPKADQDSKIVDVILESDYPQAFQIQSKQTILTKTLDNITVSICYWRRADLDRKYNRGNSYSPFYENVAIGNQSENTDVFYVKIINNRTENLIIDVNSCKIIDQGKSIYHGLNFNDLKNRFTSNKRVSGLYAKNSLEKARQILLEKRMEIVERQVGLHRVGVKPGESSEGFVPFTQVKPNATELSVIIEVEKAPPPEGAQRYQTIEFKFPFRHDRGIRVAQPAPQRY